MRKLKTLFLVLTALIFMGFSTSLSAQQVFVPNDISGFKDIVENNLKTTTGGYDEPIVVDGNFYEASELALEITDPGIFNILVGTRIIMLQPTSASVRSVEGSRFLFEFRYKEVGVIMGPSLSTQLTLTIIKKFDLSKGPKY